MPAVELCVFGAEIKCTYIVNHYCVPYKISSHSICIYTIKLTGPDSWVGFATSSHDRT